MSLLNPAYQIIGAEPRTSIHEIRYLTVAKSQEKHFISQNLWEEGAYPKLTLLQEKSPFVTHGNLSLWSGSIILDHHV